MTGSSYRIRPLPKRATSAFSHGRRPPNGAAIYDNLNPNLEHHRTPTRAGRTTQTRRDAYDTLGNITAAHGAQ